MSKKVIEWAAREKKRTVNAAVGRKHARIADHHVEAAEPFDRVADRGRDLFAITHVGEHCFDRTATLP